MTMHLLKIFETILMTHAYRDLFYTLISNRSEVLKNVLYWTKIFRIHATIEVETHICYLPHVIHFLERSTKNTVS